jgi:hypothetical protein
VSEVTALGWSYQVNFGSERQPRSLVAQVHIASDATAGEIDALLNKVARAQDHQIAYYELLDKQRLLNELLATIDRFERDLVMVEEVAKQRWEVQGRRGDWDADKHLNGSEKNARLTAGQNVKQARERGLTLQDEIAKLKERVGVTAP